MGQLPPPAAVSEIRGESADNLMLDEVAFVQAADQAPQEEGVITSTESVVTQVNEEQKRMKQIQDYVMEVAKVKEQFPKNFGRNTIKGMIDTRYATSNRKQRRMLTAKANKQAKLNMKTLGKIKQQEIKENVEVSSESSVQENSDSI